jgi:hypothetical protein
MTSDTIHCPEMSFSGTQMPQLTDKSLHFENSLAHTSGFLSVALGNARNWLRIQGIPNIRVVLYYETQGHHQKVDLSSASDPQFLLFNYLISNDSWDRKPSPSNMPVR